MNQKVYALFNYTMVTTIHRELFHVLEDANSLLSFVTDGNDSVPIDAENAEMTAKAIEELIANIMKWKTDLLDRL